jgi:hypothetical protein
MYFFVSFFLISSNGAIDSIEIFETWYEVTKEYKKNGEGDLGWRYRCRDPECVT